MDNKNEKRIEMIKKYNKNISDEELEKKLKQMEDSEEYKKEVQLKQEEYKNSESKRKFKSKIRNVLGIVAGIITFLLVFILILFVILMLNSFVGGMGIAALIFLIGDFFISIAIAGEVYRFISGKG